METVKSCQNAAWQDSVRSVKNDLIAEIVRLLFRKGLCTPSTLAFLAQLSSALEIGPGILLSSG